MDESRFAGFYMTLWSGMWVPKGAPKNVIAKLNAAVVDALADPERVSALRSWVSKTPPRVLDNGDNGLAGDDKAEIANGGRLSRLGTSAPDQSACRFLSHRSALRAMSAYDPKRTLRQFGPFRVPDRANTMT